MHTSDKGIALIQQFEGCVLKAYKLAGEKYYTIGYGHSFDSSITAGTKWTKAKALEVLKSDLRKFEGYVEDDVPHKLNQHQFDALVSYCYNRGRGGLCQLVNACDCLEDYPDMMVKLWGSATAYKTGLVRRRKAERELFLTPCEEGFDVTLKTLTKGSNGNAVKGLQRLLVGCGYSIAVDGDFGAKTDTALRDYQTCNGLTVDGVAGAKTYSKLLGV